MPLTVLILAPVVSSISSNVGVAVIHVMVVNMYLSEISLGVSADDIGHQLCNPLP